MEEYIVMVLMEDIIDRLIVMDVFIIKKVDNLAVEECD